MTFNDQAPETEEAVAAALDLVGCTGTLATAADGSPMIQHDGATCPLHEAEGIV